MQPLIRAVLACLLLAPAAFDTPAQIQPTPALAVADTPYPGTLTLQVDATDLDRRIFRVKETVPVRPGPLTLYHPK